MGGIDRQLPYLGVGTVGDVDGESRCRGGEGEILPPSMTSLGLDLQVLDGTMAQYDTSSNDMFA